FEIDSPEQMSVAFDARGDLITLIGPTVFAVGADPHYIVAKQHPAKDALTPGDRSRTNYFYIERTATADRKEHQKRVSGPLSEQEFRERAGALKLPPFQKVFRDLE
ncbi:MAG: hypothetical protein ABR611_16225, partial [Chthoniobacterales bacterium]